MLNIQETIIDPQSSTQDVVTSPAEYIKITPTLYFPGKWLVDPQLATLVWRKDNTIQLLVDGNDEPLFSCKPQEIKKFFYMSDHQRITLKDGRRFMIGMNLDYYQSRDKFLGVGIGGDITAMFSKSSGAMLQVVSLGYATGMFSSDSKNDSKWWTESLRHQGISARRISFFVASILTVVGLFLVLLIGSVIYAVITTSQ